MASRKRDEFSAATAPVDLALDRGWPQNHDAERYVLGAILMDEQNYSQVASALKPQAFSLESHRRIFLRMGELYERREKIDRVTLANELKRKGQLESVGGVTYIVSLDDGLPVLSNLDAYIRIVKEKAELRLVIMTAQKSIDRALTDSESAKDIWESAREELQDLGSNGDSSGLSSPSAIVEDFAGGVNVFLDPIKRPAGVKTGFTKFDEMTGGLRGGELIIVGARPGHGKTAFCCNIATHISIGSQGLATAIFSLEMSKPSLLDRMVCAVARVDSQKFRAGYLSKDERARLMKALAQLSQSPLFIDDNSSTSLAYLESRVRKLQREKPIGLVAVDYLQLMSVPGRFETRTLQVGHLTRGLKLLAKELNLPFMVLSQLGRSAEKRGIKERPVLSDLRESGSQEADADVVVLLFREELYKPSDENRGLAEIGLVKQRSGPTGWWKMTFLANITQFGDYARYDEPPQ